MTRAVEFARYTAVALLGYAIGADGIRLAIAIAIAVALFVPIALHDAGRWRVAR